MIKSGMRAWWVAAGLVVLAMVIVVWRAPAPRYAEVGTEYPAPPAGQALRIVYRSSFGSLRIFSEKSPATGRRVQVFAYGQRGESVMRNGEIAIEGEAGIVRVPGDIVLDVESMADVTILNHGASIKADVTSGFFKATNITGSVDAKVVGSDGASLINVEGPVHVQGSHGWVNLVGITGPVRVQGSWEWVNLSNITGAVSMNNSGGAICLINQKGGKVDLNTTADRARLLNVDGESVYLHHLRAFALLNVRGSVKADACSNGTIEGVRGDRIALNYCRNVQLVFSEKPQAPRVYLKSCSEIVVWPAFRGQVFQEDSEHVVLPGRLPATTAPAAMSSAVGREARHGE